MICPKCKTENNDGAKFCQECGEGLAGAPLASMGDHETVVAEGETPEPESSAPVFPEEAADVESLGDADTFRAGVDSASDLSTADVALDDSRGDYEATQGDSPTMAGEFGITAELAQRFEIVEELGRGGMGVVYKARDRMLRRLVALKRLTTNIQENQRAIDRFWTEAKTIASLNHHNSVRIYSLVQDELGMCLELEYVEGGDLDERLKRDGALPEDEVRDIGMQLCDAMAEAHGKGIIHRDIKPANVLMTLGGMPKLSDFGLARPMEGTHTKTGALMGTMHFAAPEQLVSGKHVDERSDIYSLGATLYALATGEPPRTVRLERVPEKLREAIGSCLEENPDNRPQSALKLKEALASGRAKAAASATACPQCGNENPVDVRFCQQCGQDLSSLFHECPKCGRESRVDVEFCGGCGTNVAQHFAIAELMDEADRLRERYDFASALAKCEDVLEVDTNHAGAKDLADVLRAKLETIDRLVTEAEAAEAAGKLQEAVERYQEVLQHHPDHEQAVEAIPRLHGEIAEAERRERAERLAGLAAEVKAAQEAKDYVKAIEACEGMLEVDPNHAGAKAHLPRLEQRRIRQLADEVREAQHAGDLDRAVEVCGQILEIQPSNADTLAHIERLNAQRIARLAKQMREAEQSGDWEEALRLCRQVLEIDPGHEAASEHSRELELAIELREPRERLREAESRGDLDEAAVVCREILNAHPEDESTRDHLARLEETIKKAAEEEKAHQIAALREKAKAALERGEQEAAIGFFQEILDIEPLHAEAGERIAGIRKELITAAGRRDFVKRALVLVLVVGVLAVLAWLGISGAEKTKPVTETVQESQDVLIAPEPAQPKAKETVSLDNPPLRGAEALEPTEPLSEETLAHSVFPAGLTDVVWAKYHIRNGHSWTKTKGRLFLGKDGIRSGVGERGNLLEPRPWLWQNGQILISGGSFQDPDSGKTVGVSLIGVYDGNCIRAQVRHSTGYQEPILLLRE